MGFNDLLQRSTGVRVVRAHHLDALEANRIRRETLDFHRKALSAVSAMERFNGRSLTPALKRKADEYAMDVLGSADHAPWLYVYATMQGVFREGWMPDNFYQLTVVPRISKGLLTATAMKSFSNVVLNTDALPDLAYHIDGIFYDRAFRVIDRAALREIARPFGKVFVKEDNSGNGSQIAIVDADGLTDHVFGNDCVLQRPIRQHPLFDEMVRGSVATLRITTARAPDGAISRRGARLRIGRAARDWVQSAHQVQAAIIDAQGTLDATVYGPDWRACTAHPDTGFVFADVRIPQFEKAVALCLGLHGKIPHIPTIGWDVAINRDEGVELIEWNGGHCGIKFCEAISGPHFRDMGWERFARKPAA